MADGQIALDFCPASFKIIHMRKRFQVALVVLLAGALGIFVWKNTPAREPIFKDKPLSFWLKGYDLQKQDLYPYARNDADIAVSRVGTNGIPYYLNLLRKKDFPPMFVLAQFAQKLHLGQFHPTRTGEYSLMAGRALARLGPEAKTAVPELLKIYDENISGISRDVILMTLGGIGPGAQEAVPLLIRASTNNVSNVRNNATYALASIHSRPELTVPRLTELLRDSDSTVRSMATTGLGEFGAEAITAVPTLASLISDSDAQVRRDIENTLGRIDPKWRERPDVVLPKDSGSKGNGSQVVVPR